MRRYILIVSVISLSLAGVFLGDVFADCESECALSKSFETLAEGRVAQMQCMQSCRQRLVWERLERTLERLATSIAMQSTQKQGEAQVAPQETVTPQAYEPRETGMPKLGEPYTLDKQSGYLTVDTQTVTVNNNMTR